jgi:serine protease Do
MEFNTENRKHNIDPQNTELIESKESKNRMSGRFYLKSRILLAFICVIIATSIITSAVTYIFWDYYDNRNYNQNSLSDESVPDASSQKVHEIISDPEGNSALTPAQINKKVSPSVVFIGTKKTTNNFFGQTQIETGTGSGIVLSSQGYIITNHHVINGAEEVSVKLYDGTSYRAEMVGKDEQTDLAVIKIDAPNLQPAEFGDSSAIEVGDLAIAIGNPLGTLEGTLTAGVISALNRTVTIDNISMTLIQTDAALNPGNSGGALANEYGQVIGVVNAKTSAVGIEGLGYAIPINDVKVVVNDLVSKGYVTGRLKIGIATKDITEDLSDYYGLPAGVYVVEVEKGSSADKAGILPKDVIIGVDGEDVLTGQKLGEIRDSHKAGDQIRILLVRNNKEKVVILTFEEDIPIK